MTPSRRTVVHAAAWAAPIVSAVSAAPSASASTSNVPVAQGSWIAWPGPLSLSTTGQAPSYNVPGMVVFSIYYGYQSRWPDLVPFTLTLTFDNRVLPAAPQLLVTNSPSPGLMSATTLTTNGNVTTATYTFSTQIYPFAGSMDQRFVYPGEDPLQNSPGDYSSWGNVADPIPSTLTYTTTEHYRTAEIYNEAAGESQWVNFNIVWKNEGIPQTF